MNLVFYVEARYIKDDKGNIYNTEGVLKFPLWQRYLEVFSHLTIVARVKHVPGYVGQKEHLANGDRVSFFELPYFHGPAEFLKKRDFIYERIKESVALDGRFLLRVPGQIGTIAAKYLQKTNRKYGVEVVGDPFDVFSKGAVNHPLRLFFKYKYYFELKKVVSKASSALYVTERALQQRYKTQKGIFSTFASNVILNEKDIKNEIRDFDSKKKTFEIISIGSLEQMYKAPDVVLKSIEIVNNSQEEYRLCLNWVGTGKYLPEMNTLASKLGIQSDINFIGYISEKEKMITLLDKADIFVLASRTEGLPRVVIEAMARGLPVIATRVGGIPELISEEFLINKNDPEALARKIKFLIANPKVAKIESEKNLVKSIEFSDRTLSIRRKEFYQSLINNF